VLTKWSHYEREMAGLFAQLETFGQQPGKAAVFRETGAQHFVGSGSYAGDNQAHPSVAQGCRCDAMTEATAASNEVTQYNEVIHRLAGSHPHVRILPFYDITVPRYDQHEESFCAFAQVRHDKTMSNLCCECVAAFATLPALTPDPAAAPTTATRRSCGATSLPRFSTCWPQHACETRQKQTLSLDGFSKCRDLEMRR